jgi:histidine triad (HIT) family protein
MSPCIFCQIVAGQSPASFVYRDERCAAFMDIQPVNPGHLLVVPVAHAASLAELDEDTGVHLARVLQRLAPAVRQSGVRCEGVDLFLADGEAAGQEVFHVHWHIIPRYSGDGFGFRFGPEYENLPPRAELDRVASSIRADTREA